MAKTVQNQNQIINTIVKEIYNERMIEEYKYDALIYTSNDT